MAEDRASAPQAYETILVETRGRVGLVRLNRPKALNALSSRLVGELNRALDGFEADAGISCVLLTGDDKAFAAGADIKEMQSLSFAEAYAGDFIAAWDRVSRFRKPLLAAGRRSAPGGGGGGGMVGVLILAADT